MFRPRHGGQPRLALEEALALDWFAPDALPADLVPPHRQRIEDAWSGATAPFIR